MQLRRPPKHIQNDPTAIGHIFKFTGRCRKCHQSNQQSDVHEMKKNGCEAFKDIKFAN